MDLTDGAMHLERQLPAPADMAGQVSAAAISLKRTYIKRGPITTLTELGEHFFHLCRYLRTLKIDKKVVQYQKGIHPAILFNTYVFKNIAMPVRKIPRNHLQVTGRHATSKSEYSADFESLLEKEHLLLLDHDARVSSYEVQPVLIPVPGVPRGYTPDLLVHYVPDEDGCIPPSEIREVKKSEDFKRNAEKYAPKFEAAERYVAQRGWVFRKIDETEIRIPRLGNLKFLSQFRFNEPEPHEVERMLSHLDKLGRTLSDELIASIAQTDEARLELMPVLWHLVITKRIGVDLDAPFGRNVELWPVENANY